MSKEQTPPLVSDADINDPKLTIPLGAKMIRDIYEADRQKTREVVQRLVDALGELRYGAELGVIEWDCQCEEDAGITCGPCGSFERGDASLALAKSQLQIEPTKP